MHPSGRPAIPGSDPNRADGEGVERRQLTRRDAPTRPWSIRPKPRRRVAGRRAADGSSYVDRYTKRDAALLLTIFMLNVGDAFFTLLWLSRGGEEANPIMAFFLDIGPTAFLAQKCFVVGVWLLILLVHKNFRFARIGLYASLAVYALLLGLHLSIIALGIEPPVDENATNTAGPAPIRTADRRAAE